MVSSPSSSAETRLHADLVEHLTSTGWAVVEPRFEEPLLTAGLLASHGPDAYLITVKHSQDARKDRLVALIAQAILEGRRGAHLIGPDVKPLAVVAAPRIPEASIRELERFAATYAPDAAVGVFDQRGLWWFSDAPLLPLNARPTRRREAAAAPPAPPANLFSDLNQWMLKLLQIGRAHV